MLRHICPLSAARLDLHEERERVVGGGVIINILAPFDCSLPKNGISSPPFLLLLCIATRAMRLGGRTPDRIKFDIQPHPPHNPNSPLSSHISSRREDSREAPSLRLMMLSII
nr:hypothetical protein HmN_000631400 [Hymenolepis microstoma]